jgi:hypothetical protein
VRVPEDARGLSAWPVCHRIQATGYRRIRQAAGSDSEHELADDPTALAELVRLGRIGQREGLLDLYPQLPAHHEVDKVLQAGMIRQFSKARAAYDQRANRPVQPVPQT